MYIYSCVGEVYNYKNYNSFMSWFINFVCMKKKTISHKKQIYILSLNRFKQIKIWPMASNMKGSQFTFHTLINRNKFLSTLSFSIPVVSKRQSKQSFFKSGFSLYKVTYMYIQGFSITCPKIPCCFLYCQTTVAVSEICTLLLWDLNIIAVSRFCTLLLWMRSVHHCYE